MGSEIKVDHTFRNKLPASMAKREDLNVWSMVKRSCGKELSAVTMPVVFNEPLSFLQRMVEYMEYSSLLTKASEESNPLVRMQYMSAFAVSALSSNWERPGKPFNPLLGETYELQRDGFKGFLWVGNYFLPTSIDIHGFDYKLKAFLRQSVYWYSLQKSPHFFSLFRTDYQKSVHFLCFHTFPYQ